VSELLSLRIEAGSGGLTVRAVGEIDLDSAPRLRECLAFLVGDVVLNLAEVSFIDSSGIAVLVAEHKRRVSSGEKLIITGSSSMARRVFQVTGVDRVLDLNGDSPHESAASA